MIFKGWQHTRSSLALPVVRLGLVLAILGASLVSLIGLGQVANADTAPVSSVRTSGKNIYYTVAYSQYTDAGRTDLAVYYDHMPRADYRVWILAPDDSGPSRCGGNMVVRVVVAGVLRSDASACDSYSSNGWQIGSGGLQNVTYDPNTGMYRLDVTVIRRSGEGHFRFRLSAGGLVRSVASGVMSYETTFPRATEEHGNYRLNFGSDCTIPTAGVSRTITIVDPDNYPEDTTGAQRSESFYVHVEEATRTGAFRRISSSRYTNLSPYIYRSGDQLRPSLDGEQVQFNFNMLGEHRYRLVFEGLDSNNTIQVRLPTDEIYHDIPCRWWEDAGESRTTVRSGSQATPTSWSAPGVYSTRASASAAGQRIFFAHRIENLTNNQSARLETWVQRWWTGNPSAHSPVTSAQPPGGWTPAPVRVSDATFPTPDTSWGRYYYYVPRGSAHVVTTSDLQRTDRYLCERIATRPVGHASNPGGLNQGWRLSEPACTYLEQSYNIQPVVQLGRSSIGEGETMVEGITARFEATGTRASDPSIHFLSRFVVRAGQPLANSGGEQDIPYQPGTGALVNNWECYIAQSVFSGTECKRFIYGSGGESLNQPHNQYRTIPTNGSPYVFSVMNNGSDDISSIANLQVGDRVCYILGLSRYGLDPPASGSVESTTKDNNDFRYSAPVCVTVAKVPKVQFWGGDVQSEGMVRTMSSTANSRMYGSWAEYAILSNEPVSSASGASLSAGVTGRSPLGAAELNRLTFANTGAYGQFGQIIRTEIPATLTGGPGAALSGSPSIAGLNGVYNASTLQLGGGELGPGRRVVIRASGTVRITGNITYQATNYTAATIPQVVIVADNIVIDAAVTEVNGWLIARGTGNSGYVSTCGPVGVSTQWLDGLNSTTCNNPLRINGPIVANHLYLRRTFGSEAADRGAPAEILNLRPDTYISAYEATRNTSNIRTNYIRELPPRF
ncbi:hypothetical protein B7Z00_00055 [Candidatus Saccharibacteria bacterium 32-50-10]|nr:MAG: hypothetical protein B7Z00_00055 [Candidatus Saccharibacteria bacterium 32-50-10]